jgi:hypothetical protein
MSEKQKIVTFTCNNGIHIYSEKSGVKPMFPYKIHTSIDNAVKYLKEDRGIDDPKILYK